MDRSKRHQYKGEIPRDALSHLYSACRTLADVYKKPFKRGNQEFLYFIADIPCQELEIEPQDSKDQPAIESEIKTPTRKAYGRSRKKGKTEAKSKSSPKIEKRPMSTSKLVAAKQEKNTCCQVRRNSRNLG